MKKLTPTDFKFAAKQIAIKQALTFTKDQVFFDGKNLFFFDENSDNVDPCCITKNIYDLVMLGFICNKKVYYQLIGDRHPEMVKTFNEFINYK